MRRHATLSTYSSRGIYALRRDGALDVARRNVTGVTAQGDEDQEKEEEPKRPQATRDGRVCLWRDRL